jgi:hypothetical protein
MNRWWLLPYSRWRPAIRIHEILRSDDDRAFHDHPWAYITIILRGGYWEVQPVFNVSGIYTGDKRKWYAPGSILFRRAKSWHRLEIEPGAVATTLFITFKYRQKWGFMPNPARNKIDYESYFAEYGKTKNPNDSSKFA